MRIFLLAGSISGFLSVALGAFAAHALKNQLGERELAILRTGIDYQFYHALALVLVASLWDRVPSLSATGWFFILGTVVFSGSLYALALTGIKVFGAITPLGGVSFLIGWALLIWRAW